MQFGTPFLINFRDPPKSPKSQHLSDNTSVSFPSRASYFGIKNHLSVLDPLLDLIFWILQRFSMEDVTQVGFKITSKIDMWHQRSPNYKKILARQSHSWKQLVPKSSSKAPKAPFLTVLHLLLVVALATATSKIWWSSGQGWNQCCLKCGITL